MVKSYDQEIVLTGRISKVSTRVMIGAAALVELDQPQDGIKYAIINNDTRGRNSLILASPNGRLVEGTPVKIRGVKRGPESYFALSVSLI